MFFPSYSEIITERFSRKKNTITFDGSEITETYLSLEDRIRKTYGDGKMIDIKPGSKCTESKTIRIVKGETLKCGFRRFLSNNDKTTHLVRFKKGVPKDEPVEFDLLSGKYLLICCFNVPMISYHAEKCRAIIDAYDELSERGYPFEMVVVSNLRTDVDYNLKAAFDHFYSAFSCLAIPFSDFGTRDYIHSCMTRSSNRRWEQGYWAILVDPEGIILQDDQALYHFFDHGSEWAPFLPTTLDAIEKQDEVFRLKLDPMHSPLIHYVTLNEADRQQPLSLHGDVLLCDPCLTLRRFDAAAETDADVFSTVVDLSRKYVGLYLCIDGEIMEDIKAAHDHCLANNQQLEIVLVPMPFNDEPNSFNKDLHQTLRLLNIKSWFIFDYNSKSCRRLWRIFGLGYPGPMDKFIIIPPNSESGELYGREVIINFGINQYPFTRTAILKQRLEYLRSLTPVFSSSLFNNCLMIQNNQEFKSEQLQGKNVLLYITWNECNDHYSLVKNHYPEIKAMGWEVVLVLLDYTTRYWNRIPVDRDYECYKCPCLNLKEIPWPFMLLSTAAKASIKEKLFFPNDCRHSVYLFAVAKDGKIVSRDVHHRLNTHGVTESLFDDVLEADLARGLAKVPLLDHRY